MSTASKIPATKASTIKVGDHDSYDLRPAASRTHYGENRLHGGGTPYAYATKKAEGAWFVVSRRSGEILGVLEEHDDDWSFCRVTTHGDAPQWLRKQMAGATSGIVYNLRAHCHSGTTPLEALSYGLKG